MSGSLKLAPAIVLAKAKGDADAEPLLMSPPMALVKIREDILSLPLFGGDLR